ncbi:MAG: aminotransferase class III-fold pyridoxal phosphate-dependent enzyme [Verrucomicrobia bacterium]|nr:aminotransferase class III-fold pyridoxal phosphate-dependent enzyme [Verrucomicrobiota bacterium]
MSHSDSLLIQNYVRKTPKSRALYERAKSVFPSGVTHDARYLDPYPISVTHAQGPLKWDVDGNEYVDYFGGHGALLLGHNHPAVVEAVQQQLTKGTHYGASHELELRWAELIIEMVPCAEKVRFTASGTEATMLAFTGKNKIMRFKTHFHGWHDQVAYGAKAPVDGLPSGIPQEMTQNIVLCPANDAEEAARLLQTDNDIAAIIVEPTGSSFGHVPTPPEFVSQLSVLTKQHNVLLIFDEVISGFRAARGGAQEVYGITPDMATMAKAMAGGFPTGAVMGSKAIMDMMTIRADDAEWNANRRIPHFGTFNANPIAASAGMAQLEIIRSTDAIEKANATAALIRDGMNEAIVEEDLSWVTYGRFSDFHVFLNPDELDISAADIDGARIEASVLKSVPGNLQGEFRAGWLAEGVDVISWPGGVVSSVHTQAEVDRTLTAFRALIQQFKQASTLQAV